MENTGLTGVYQAIFMVLLYHHNFPISSTGTAAILYQEFLLHIVQIYLSYQLDNIAGETGTG
jgi:hypothetical protein